MKSNTKSIQNQNQNTTREENKTMKSRKQRYTSADTSINSSKLPAVYKKTAKMISATDTVIDYGCGKHFDTYGLDDRFTGYDPFNYDHPEALEKHYDVAFLSNVLNVIAESEVRAEILRTLQTLANRVYITVYEGNKSGIGKVTKRDCYQLNRRLCDYIPEVVAVFGYGNVHYKSGMLICDTVSK